MKVFLSWSGEHSHRFAIMLRDWLPQVIQALVPYVSSEDIDKGARWSVDIAKELDSSTYGIICITPDNIEAPWINFEAGALSKTLDRARVSPLLFGVRPSDIKGPLVQFQATFAEQDDIWKLILSLNSQCGESMLDEPRLRRAFDVWWPDLQNRLNEELRQATAPTRRRGSADVTTMMEEVLELVRGQQRQLTALQDKVETISTSDTSTKSSKQPVKRDPVTSFSFDRQADGSIRVVNDSLREFLVVPAEKVPLFKSMCEAEGLKGIVNFLNTTKESQAFAGSARNWERLTERSSEIGLEVSDESAV